jgi:CheY-like chemotaxis protein
MPSVLIVEDDAFVRECLYRGFIAEGWTARQAADPSQALGWVQIETFDLVLSDVMMPGMSGTELVRRIRALKPDTRAVLMSGYPAQYLQRQDCDTEVAPFFQKPFPIKALLEKANAMVAKDAATDQATPA